MSTAIFTPLSNTIGKCFIAAVAMSALSCTDNNSSPELPAPVGNLQEARAYWLSEDTVAWDVPEDSRVRMHFSRDAAFGMTSHGLEGGQFVELARDGEVSGQLSGRFPHLAGMPAFRFAPTDVSRVPSILKTQFAVSAHAGGVPLDATALQHAGVLDDLFAFDGELGVVFREGIPHFRLWAPTARSVKLHLFDRSDPGSAPSAAAPSMSIRM